MSWTKKNVHPGKIVSTSQEVEVMVLDVDEQKRRISLGLKQCLSNPWDQFVEQFTAGSEIEGEIKNITEFGLFVGLPGDIDGMVHLSDLDWSKSGEEAVKGYSKGDMVKVKVLDVDVEKERISLGIKQLSEDPFGEAIETIKKGAVVTGTVNQVQDNGIELQIGEGVVGFIRKAELSRDRSEQRPDRFAVGERLDAKVISIDKKTRKVTLSIKQREIQEEKQAMADYGSSDSGASLGDILGAAISRAAKAIGPDEEPKAEQAKAGEVEAEAPAEAEAAEADADSGGADDQPAAEVEEKKETKKAAAPKKKATTAKKKTAGKAAEKAAEEAEAEVEAD
jgi:small subunit ribosomal protein S1